MNRIDTALISVADKTGVEALAKALAGLGISIVSTGGTAARLREAGLAIRDVSELTGFPEIMDGRVKTLHPAVHGGLLGRRGVDRDVMQAHGIEPIGLVVVNLYPFEETVARPDCSRDDAVENIDIGGPAMIRAAAKNHRDVGVITDPADYDRIIAELKSNDGMLGDTSRRQLAAKAFAYTATYDGAIWHYLNRVDGGETLPGRLPVALRREAVLRYGENPHQKAALYRQPGTTSGSLVSARQCQGKPLSYNNLADADAALECVKCLPAPACVIVKHANPCGAATAPSLATAYDLAYATDPESAFGGVIAANVPVDETLAATLVDRQFLEVIVAPEFSDGALEAFGQKPNIRVLQVDNCAPGPAGIRLQQIEGGLLAQDADRHVIDRDALRIVTERRPDEAEISDALMAWELARHVKSNAIVYCRGGTTLGIGAGQPSRIMSARIAAMKARQAGLELGGAVMASDAFFPFRDGIDAAAGYGISVVIQPGGSIRDDEVIAAANEHGMAMLFTGIRHFRH